MALLPLVILHVHMYLPVREQVPVTEAPGGWLESQEESEPHRSYKCRGKGCSRDSWILPQRGKRFQDLHGIWNHYDLWGGKDECEKACPESLGTGLGGGKGG